MSIWKSLNFFIRQVFGKGSGTDPAPKQLQPDHAGEETIDLNATTLREQKRRRREWWLAGLAGLLIVVATLLEYKYLGAESYLFLALFNFNFVLILLVLFLLGRNIIKLAMERRRKVLGSKLRTRLVLIFLCLTLGPSMLLFVSSMKFTQISFDFWFRSQVESAMDNSVQLGQIFLDDARDRLGRMSEALLAQIEKERISPGSKRMDNMLAAKRQEYNLSLLGLTDAERNEISWHASKDNYKGWPEIRSEVSWRLLEDSSSFWSATKEDPAGDMVLGIMPLEQGRGGYMVLTLDLGQGFLFRLNQTARSVNEYKDMQILNKPIKRILYFPLIVTYLLIVLGATWFGFRLAKEISAPIQAMAAATQRIAKGDLSVRLKDDSSDEMGLLVRLFNTMAEDLQASRAHITETNQQLADKNVELEERRRYIETVLENIAAGVLSWDPSGHISTINKAAVEMLGLPSTVLSGQGYLPKAGRQRLETLFDQARRQHWEILSEPWRHQLEWLDQDRKIMITVVALDPDHAKDGGLVAVLEDITELEKGQRLAAWREVARRIAHEIKNPLTPIKLSAQRLERKFSAQVGDPVFGQCTQLIVRQVEYLQQMVTEFSAFAKLPEVVLTMGDFVSLLEEVVDMFRSTHRGIQWNLSGAEIVPQIRFDRRAMHQALVNILTNAAEALEGQSQGRVDIIVEASRRRDWIRIEIRDNGRGLTEEERSRLFEPYFSRKKSGTGLGLTIVSSIISDHQGYVRVMPAPDSGTIMSVELPVSA